MKRIVNSQIKKVFLLLFLSIMFSLKATIVTLASNEQYPSFTLEQLSKYDGKNGSKAYIACNGYIYDISKDKNFKDGFHVQCMRTQAGKDITELMSYAPKNHSKSNFFNKYQIVGVLAGAQVKNESRNSFKYDLLDKKEIIVSLGWISFFLFILSGLLHKALRNIKLLYNDPKGKYKKLLNYHCYLGYMVIIPLLLHLVKYIKNIKLSISWILVLLYLVIIFSGIARKYFKLKNIKIFKIIHGWISITAIILTLYHIYDKIF